MDKGELKTVLFGYDRKTVDIFLNKLHRMQEEELTELRRRIDKSKGVRERLQKQLQKLNDKLDAADPAADNEIPYKVTAVDFTDAAKKSRKLNAVNARINKPTNDTDDVPETENIVPVLPSAAPAEAARAAPPPIIRSKKAGTGFWEDADPYIEQPTDLLQTANEASAAAEPSSPAAPLVNSVLPEETKTAAFEAEPAINKPHSEGPEQVVGQPGEPEAEAPIVKPSSPEIEALKISYIVGKAAGDDLLDRQGRLIAARGTAITADIVQRAEREGKLAELIVHMIIPGMED